MRLKISKSLLLSTSLLAILPSSVLAQDASESDFKLEEIVTLGTRTKGRSVADSAVPIDVIDVSSIERAAALPGGVGPILQALIPSVNFPRQSNADTADNVRPIQLRGLAPDQTLVMVNGKRRHITAAVGFQSTIGNGSTPVDVGTIATNSISSIEVLRDGAGAQYGSDAIAGVVNFNLKGGAEGGQISAAYGFHNTNFKPTADTTLDITDGKTVLINGDVGFGLGDGGFIRVGGEYLNRNSTNRAGFDDVPFFEEFSDEQIALNDPIRGVRNYAPGDGDLEEVNLFFNALLPIGDEGELYAFGTYGRRNSEGTNFFRYPANSEVSVLEIFPEGYLPVSVATNNDAAFYGGVRGVASDWNWDFSVGYGKNSFEYDYRRTLNASFGTDSQTEFKGTSFSSDQLALNLDVDREFEAGDGTINVAFGAEYRNEGYRTFAGDFQSYAAGPITDAQPGVQSGPGISPDDEVDLTRSIFAAYLDLEYSPSDAVIFGLAGRFENFSDFGSSVMGKATTRVQIADGIALRGAMGTSFRAPSLVQQGYQASTTGFGDGGGLTTIRHVATDSAIGQALGAVDLTEEQSFNLSAGLVLTPFDGFNLTVDVFSIKIADRLGVSERIQFDGITDFIFAETGIADVTAATFFNNAVDTRTKGIDVVASFTADAAGGTLVFTSAYSYADTNVTNVKDTPAVLSAFGVEDAIIGLQALTELQEAAPKSKLILSADWSNDRWSALVRATRFGGATRLLAIAPPFFVPEQTYGAEWGVDLEFGWQATEAVTVTFGVNNLLDNYPDRSIYDITYFGNLPFDYLSPIGMNGRYLYSRIGYKF